VAGKAIGRVDEIFSALDLRERNIVGARKNDRRNPANCDSKRRPSAHWPHGTLSYTCTSGPGDFKYCDLIASAAQ
jgi:hypothetical protein